LQRNRGDPHGIGICSSWSDVSCSLCVKSSQAEAPHRFNELNELWEMLDLVYPIPSRALAVQKIG
jgi:hypothetical protein